MKVNSPTYSCFKQFMFCGRRVFLAVCFFVLGGCATNQTSSTVVNIDKLDPSIADYRQWALMVGRWYGSQPSEQGGRYEWIAERKKDGGYETHFRMTTKGGKISESIEVGEWGVSGPVYFSIFKGWMRDGRFVPSNPADPYNRDAYKIISLTDESFTYKHFVSGNHFTAKRVSESFSFGEN